MCGTWVTRVGLAVLVAALVIGDASQAASPSKNKKKNNQSGQGIAQMAGAVKQAISILQNRNEIAARVKAQAEQRAIQMQGKAASATADVQANGNARYSSESSLNRLQEDAQTAKKSITGQQDPESEYALAKASHDEALADLDAARDAIFDSADYQQALAAARAAANAGEAVSRVQREALAENAAYQEALAEYNARKAVLSDVTAKLLKADPTFQQTIDQMSQTAEQVAAAREAFETSLLKKAAAISNLGHAQRLAAEAADMIAKNNAKIAALKATGERLARAAADLKRRNDRDRYKDSAGSKSNKK